MEDRLCTRCTASQTLWQLPPPKRWPQRRLPVPKLRTLCAPALGSWLEEDPMALFLVTCMDRAMPLYGGTPSNRWDSDAGDC